MGSNTGLRSTLLLVLVSTLLALLLGRVMLRVVADFLVVSYQPAPGEFVRAADGLHWPAPSLFRTGNRKGSPDNFPLLHDADGFTPGRLPRTLWSRHLQGFTPAQRAVLEKFWIDQPPLFESGAGGHEQVLLTVGDSNIRVNFEHLREALLPRRVRISAAAGVPNTGPDMYYRFVARWLAAGGEMARYLDAHPDTDLAVDVYLTPHNDLEDLRAAAMPESTQLVLPALPAVAPATSPAVAGKRDRLRTLAAALGLNAAEITVLRSAMARLLPQSVFSDRGSFLPRLEQRNFRKALAYVDMIRQALARFVNPQRQVYLNLVVLPSVYDLPGLHLDYSWDALLDRYVAGEFLAPGSDAGVVLNNLHLRELFQAWHPADADYATLFDKGDLHYTLAGMVDLAIGMALCKHDLPQDWLTADGRLPPERLDGLRNALVQRHVAVMAAFETATGERP